MYTHAHLLIFMSSLISSGNTLSLPIGPLVISVLALIVIALLVLVAMVIQLSTRLRHLSTPIYDQIVGQAQEKARQVLADAEEQARTLRAAAQTAADKLLSDRKLADDQLSASYANHFKELISNADAALATQAQEVQKHSVHFSEQFAKVGDQISLQLQEESKRVQEAAMAEVESMRKVFADLGAVAAKEQEVLVAQMRKQVADLFEKEAAGVREQVAAYRKERSAAIDLNIVALVEETTRIALGKALSLQEHRDIIMAALEQARRDGIFGRLPA